MNKFLRTLYPVAALLTILCGSLLATACGDDDDDQLPRTTTFDGYVTVEALGTMCEPVPGTMSWNIADNKLQLSISPFYATVAMMNTEVGVTTPIHFTNITLSTTNGCARFAEKFTADVGMSVNGTDRGTPRMTGLVEGEYADGRLDCKIKVLSWEGLPSFIDLTFSFEGMTAR